MIAKRRAQVFILVFVGVSGPVLASGSQFPNRLQNPNADVGVRNRTFAVGLASRAVVTGGVVRLRAFESLTNRRMKHSAFDGLVERFDRRTGLREVMLPKKSGHHLNHDRRKVAATHYGVPRDLWRKPIIRGMRISVEMILSLIAFNSFED